MGDFKLLIVDDEESIIFLLQKIYEKSGYKVFVAADGVTAVEIFEKERPDLSFIDVHMPYSPIDGIETLQRIKEIDKNAYCVMITRIDDRITVAKARSLGALHYIPKPFETEELDKCINEVKQKLGKQ
jgi:DNA-binding response OmpR family regulator